MNLNELYQNIPEELHGNIAVSATRVSITESGGKKANSYALGLEVESEPIDGMEVTKAKEVIGVDVEALKAITVK